MVQKGSQSIKKIKIPTKNELAMLIGSPISLDVRNDSMYTANICNQSAIKGKHAQQAFLNQVVWKSWIGPF